MDIPFLIKQFRSSSILWINVRDDFEQYVETIKLPPKAVSMAEQYIASIYGQPDYDRLIQNISHPASIQRLFLVKGAPKHIETFYVMKRYRAAFWVVFALTALFILCLVLGISARFLLLYLFHIIILMPTDIFLKELHFSLGKRLLALDWLMEDNAELCEHVSESIYGSRGFFKDPLEELSHQEVEDQVDEDYDIDGCLNEESEEENTLAPYVALKYKCWARGIAKAQVLTLRKVKREYPDLSPEEQYVIAIAARANITKEVAVDIVARAMEAENTSNYKNIFRNITLDVCDNDHKDYVDGRGVPIVPHIYDAVFSAVYEVVPHEL